MGSSSEPAGLVLSGGGLLLLALMPVVGTLTTRVPARDIIAAGWFITAAAMFYATQHLDLGIRFSTASVMRVAQVAGMPLLFVHIMLISYVGLPAEKTNSIAGIVSFTRNIGSSIGTSLVTTVVARQAQVHQVYLAAHTSRGEPALDRKSTRLNSSHQIISYAVFCLKK